MPHAAPRHGAAGAASPKHQATAERGSASARGYDRRWQKERARWLREHPLCKHCDDEGKVFAGNVVDHIVPHRGDQKLFWDRANWQTLCKTHHDRKTGGGQ